MATLDSTMLDYEKPDAMRYLRVHGPMHRAALGMLLTGKPDSTDPAVKQFVNFANQQDMNIDECWRIAQRRCSLLQCYGHGRGSGNGVAMAVAMAWQFRMKG